MFERILVVCEGNICRSPVAEVMLQRKLPACRVSSAGLSALVGYDINPLMREVALGRGQECPPHVARKLTTELAGEADLILVMEGRQRERMIQQMPQASGKIMLLGKWLGERDIPDPYRRSREVHEQICRLLEEATEAWSRRLNGGGRSE